MDRYFTHYSTEADFIAAEPSLIKPHVSFVEDGNKMHYMEDPANGHKYVDLGLPSGTKWATMNVGATGVTDYGNYYMYGKGDSTYQQTSGQSAYSGTENPLAINIDTARQEWGGEWHMPTQAQLNELTANTTHQWVTDYQGSGVNGITFIAENEEVLFIPAAGRYYEGTLYRESEQGNIWSSTPNGSDSVYYLDATNSGRVVINGDRYCAFSVRPVLDDGENNVIAGGMD